VERELTREFVPWQLSQNQYFFKPKQKITLPLDANLKRFVNHIKPLSTSGANARALQDEQYKKAPISLSHFV
jgi:hypothetical protein